MRKAIVIGLILLAGNAAADKSYVTIQQPGQPPTFINTTRAGGNTYTTIQQPGQQPTFIREYNTGGRSSSGSSTVVVVPPPQKSGVDWGKLLNGEN